MLHFPLSVMVPRRRDARRRRRRSSTSSTSSCRSSSRAPSARTAAASTAGRCGDSRLVITISRARGARRSSSGSGSPRSGFGRSTSGSTTTSFGRATSRASEFLLYPARGWPHKNHARLFEAFAELRREAPGLELVLTAYDGPVPEGVRSLGPRAARGARPPLPDRRGARLPEPVRGLRPAAARGDGLRLPGRVLERRLAAGGRRRRGAPLRSVLDRGDRGRGRGRARRPRAWRAAGSSAPPGSRGRRPRVRTTRCTRSWRTR